MYCVRSILCPNRQFYRNVCPAIQLKNNPVTSIKPYEINFAQYSVDSDEDESEKIVDDICRGDAELEKKLKVIMLEVELMRQDGRSAPDHLHVNHWQHLLGLSSRKERSKFLAYLSRTRIVLKYEKVRREERKKKFLESHPKSTQKYPDDLIYGLSHQSLFTRIQDVSINKFDNYRALQAMQHGQSVILDCSYDEHMPYRQAVNAAKQMSLVFGHNRIHKEPFNIHLCNVNWDGLFMRQLKINIPNLTEPWFPLNIHTESYLDIFPREKLIYLTPHCHEELTTFDHDAIYIVGCMVDKRYFKDEPLSLAKAESDGIKMAKLPLDRYLTWDQCSLENLKIKQMIPILLDLKQTGDWEYALKHIPIKKFYNMKKNSAVPNQKLA